MKRRTWRNKEKTTILREGFKGRLVNDICLEHQINQSQYYKWRDQFLSQAETLFEAGKPNKAEERLQVKKKRGRKHKGSSVTVLVLEQAKAPQSCLDAGFCARLPSTKGQVFSCQGLFQNECH